MQNPEHIATRNRAEIRAKLLEAPDVIAVRIGRDGSVSVRTTAPRGDGGRVPWWRAKGCLENYREMSNELWGSL